MRSLLHARFARHVFLAAGLAGALGAAAPVYSPEKGYGPNPKLPPPDRTLIPMVDIAPAKGWPVGRTPVAASGLTVQAWAEKLDHPRSLIVLPNGDVLVAETNAPQRPEHGKSIKGVAMKVMMKKAGAAVPSANRIALLRDADGDGHAETRTVFLSRLNSPFGMALVRAAGGRRCGQRRVAGVGDAAVSVDGS